MKLHRLIKGKICTLGSVCPRRHLQNFLSIADADAIIPNSNMGPTVINSSPVLAAHLITVLIVNLVQYCVQGRATEVSVSKH